MNNAAEQTTVEVPERRDGNVRAVRADPTQGGSRSVRRQAMLAELKYLDILRNHLRRQSKSTLAHFCKEVERKGHLSEQSAKYLLAYSYKTIAMLIDVEEKSSQMLKDGW